MINLYDNKIKKVHFIGIGGISMSGIAKILMSNGFIVSGSDESSSHITHNLKELGIKIFIGHNSRNVENSDLVVYTAAVKENNVELLGAKELCIPIIDRATLLGLIMDKYTNSIAISGTHGKTTTTSLISIIFKNANLDPTIMLGGELDALGGNVRVGDSSFFISEACEYVESFLKLKPYIGIILNVDADHLDYYSGIDHIIKSFNKFAKLIKNDGYIIVPSDDANTKKAMDDIKINTITFGLSKDSDWNAQNISYDSLGYGEFDVYNKNNYIGTFKLNVPGEHNIKNALCAIACARIFHIDFEIIKKSLLEFQGTHRRFEIKGTINGITIIDDYAHHPTEIKATLAAVKNYPHKKIWCIFQPHTYTRTLTLFDEFSCAFNDADYIILTDIYAAREKDDGRVNSKMLCDNILKNNIQATYIKSFEDISNFIYGNANSGDIVITMGAGDVYKIGDIILDK